MIEYLLDSTLAEVARLGEAVRARLDEAGAPGDVAGEVELVLVELATNVVEHAYSGAAGSPVRVRMWMDAEGVEVEIADRGDALPPNLLWLAEMPEIDPDDPASLPEGGFGLPLIRALSDSLAFHREDPWNILTFTRNFIAQAHP